MIKKDFLKHRLTARLINTDFYKDVVSSHDRYRLRILVILFSIVTAVSAYLLAEYYLTGKTVLLGLHLVFACVMFVLTCYLLISRNLRFMVIASMITLYTAFFLTAFLGHYHEITILLILTFIPLAFSLAGSGSGARWVLFFVVSLLAAWAGIAAGFLPSWNISAYSELYMPVAVSLVAMFAVIFAARVHYEHALGRLAKSMVFDRITGLPGKDYFISNMRNVENSIIAIVHIINFRGLSSLFGYEFSDRILVMLSDILREEGAASGFSVFKLAWHEFGLQIPVDSSITPDEAEYILKGIIEKVRGSRTRWGQTEISIAICAGGIIIRGYDYDRAISGANAALGTGLKNHRSVTIFNESMDLKVDALDDATRFTDLHDNILNGTLKSYLQPVVYTESGDVCWHEALLRVKENNGEYGSVYPYLAVAKDTGLYPHLTEFMLNRAHDILKNTDLSISINICLRDMLSSSVLEKVKEITGIKEYSPGRLILEIVESDDIGNVESCYDFIAKVKSMGVSIAIDDFGSGYSNYANLLSMGVDIVKIDGTLIRRLEHDNDAAVLINGIVDFCRNAQRKIVAEFVENSWLHEKLSDMNVNYCQGYFFGEPFDPDVKKA